MIEVAKPEGVMGPSQGLIGVMKSTLDQLAKVITAYEEERVDYRAIVVHYAGHWVELQRHKFAIANARDEATRAEAIERLASWALSVD